MNYLAVVILVFITADLLLNITADYLNLRDLTDKIPYHFKGIYNTEKYLQSQAYLRVNTRFGWITSGIDLLVLLTFWFAAGFDIVDQWIRAFGFGPILNGLFFIGILLLFKSVISLPLSIYSTFVIEERFGFNRTGLKTFIGDRLKGLGLALLLGVPVLSLVLFFFETAGNSAWWFCWVAVTLFSLCIQFVAPTWIMPIFNKFEPLEDVELKSTILSYAQSIGFPFSNVFVMDGSKRSSKSNAFFAGFGRHKRIVLFDTLITNHTKGELLAVLAHEMGHYRKRHIIKMVIYGILQTGLMFYLLSLAITHPALFDAFFMTENSIYAGFIFFGMLYAPLDFFFGILSGKLSRRHEYEADRFAVSTTGVKQDMIDALKKISVDNLTNLLPHPFYVSLHHSHPPVLDRIRAIESLNTAIPTVERGV
ncbi:MAG: M48 family metallopeptidase [Desulfobacteraceae bacterium]|nr:M48 family metallopeptidase [Desulfobacteraceae bacterium]